MAPSVSEAEGEAGREQEEGGGFGDWLSLHFVRRIVRRSSSVLVVRITDFPRAVRVVVATSAWNRAAGQETARVERIKDRRTAATRTGRSPAKVMGRGGCVQRQLLWPLGDNYFGRFRCDLDRCREYGDGLTSLWTARAPSTGS